MRTLSTLATLLLGLATTAALVVTVISPLHAGHIGGGEGHGGGGGEEPPPPVLSPVVVDSLGAVVGLADLGSGSTVIDAAVVYLQLDDGRLAVLKAEPGALRGDQLDSESPGCAEPLFLLAGGGLLEILLPRASVGPDEILYVQSDPSAFDTVDIVSSVPLCDGNCVPNVIPTRGDAILAEPVMLLDFVPPFHIE